MPAKSRSQQRLFGMIHAAQKGTLKHPPKKIKQMAGKISPTSVTHFAETKHTKLPEKKAAFKTAWTVGSADGEYSDKAERFLSNYVPPAKGLNSFEPEFWRQTVKDLQTRYPQDAKRMGWMWTAEKPRVDVPLLRSILGNKTVEVDANFAPRATPKKIMQRGYELAAGDGSGDITDGEMAFQSYEKYPKKDKTMTKLPEKKAAAVVPMPKTFSTPGLQSLNAPVATAQNALLTQGPKMQNLAAKTPKLPTAGMAFGGGLGGLAGGLGGAALGGAYGLFSDPGVDSETGKPKSRVANMLSSTALGGLGGAALGGVGGGAFGRHIGNVAKSVADRRYQNYDNAVKSFSDPSGMMKVQSFADRFNAFAASGLVEKVASFASARGVDADGLAKLIRITGDAWSRQQFGEGLFDDLEKVAEVGGTVHGLNDYADPTQWGIAPGQKPPSQGGQQGQDAQQQQPPQAPQAPNTLKNPGGVAPLPHRYRWDLDETVNRIKHEQIAYAQKKTREAQTVQHYAGVGPTAQGQQGQQPAPAPATGTPPPAAPKTASCRPYGVKVADEAIADYAGAPPADRPKGDDSSWLGRWAGVNALESKGWERRPVRSVGGAVLGALVPPFGLGMMPGANLATGGTHRDDRARYMNELIHDAEQRRGHFGSSFWRGVKDRWPIALADTAINAAIGGASMGPAGAAIGGLYGAGASFLGAGARRSYQDAVIGNLAPKTKQQIAHRMADHPIITGLPFGAMIGASKPVEAKEKDTTPVIKEAEYPHSGVQEPVSAEASRPPRGGKRAFRMNSKPYGVKV